MFNVTDLFKIASLYGDFYDKMDFIKVSRVIDVYFSSKAF